ncbi:class I adenylate-forming enzyme family protein [Dactylosporangium sp. CA-233914]|uniref:class I adenylate-forming enzyme family protein n=1 Tax=Dactylosporangium sp. CA-233914 TaxID=3239934 RepID=UPI003D936063
MVEVDGAAVAAEDEAGRSVTRAALLGAAVEAALVLRAERALAPGAHVGLHLENTLENAALVIALAGSGLVVAPISTKLTAAEVRRQVSSSRLALVITDGGEADLAAEWELGIPVLDAAHVVTLDGGPVDPAAVAEFVEAAKQCRVTAPATIICTSGSTSLPKPIVLSHGNLMFAIVSCQEYYALSPLDVGLTFFPWCHSNGHVNQLLSWLALGVRIVIAERFTASGFPDQLRKYRPTVAFLNGTHVKMVLANLEGDEPIETPLRIVPTALDLDAETCARFTRIFGALQRKVYYQTELCAPVAICDLHPVRFEYNSNPIGHVALSHRIRLVDAVGKDVSVGTPGEIWVRSVVPYGVALGRIDHESGDLVRYDPDDWWRTGDLAVADGDGYLYYAGRTSEMIKRAGHNVAIPEVVDTLLEHPAVDEAAVIGVPDAVREEQIVAFVVGGADPDEVIAFSAERLAPYKVPSVVIAVAELPRTDLGKLDTKDLRRQWDEREQVNR